MKRLNVCTERDLLPTDSTANPVVVWFCVLLLLLLLRLTLMVFICEEHNRGKK